MKRYLSSLLFLVIATQASAQAQFLIDFAKQALAQAQANSLETGREFCGYIGVDKDGRLAATKARRGRADVCRPRNPPRNWQDIVASYHTHGTFTLNADSEVPSSSDIRADANEGVDGFLVTPGGRVWFIDGVAQSARMICGLKCLQSDPNYEIGYAGAIKKAYTLDGIIARENSDH